MIRISNAERRARLARRHRLVGGERSDDVAAITDAVVCLHSSDPASVYLSAAARMGTPGIAATAAALFDDRSIVRHHAMRRTLWVMTPGTARAAHAACTVKIAAAQRKQTVALIESSGIARDGSAWYDAARAEVLATLTESGSATTRELGRAVPALTAKLHLAVGKPYQGTQSAHSRILTNLGFDGAIVRGRQSGSWITAEYAWAVMDTWLEGGVVGMETGAGATALLTRYLDRFGPATTADITWWTGWTQTLARRSLDAIGATPVQLEDGRDAWVLPGDEHAPDAVDPWVAFLPGLDPTTMGWKERSWYLGDHATFGRDVFDRNGNGGPTIWVDGQVVGAWVQRPDGAIATEYFTSVPTRRRRALAAAEEELRSTVGDTRFKLRFPGPVHQALLAAAR